ncbi:hypothetical protein C8034_v009893 [Colletotrichum sidae]|uniref:Uncharacterized protein n=2 Tax=Colletotrichum orbiculare species complex TaxID=2707354 RepID=N4V4T1_COLOR|nr:hypothetical protein Cob_v006694 [Colletotrichum orbiculare MAFF 240422]TEA22453.1 hypothetical protein C8034_v009893 [Colletotrichum sidae]
MTILICDLQLWWGIFQPANPPPASGAQSEGPVSSGQQVSPLPLLTSGNPYGTAVVAPASGGGAGLSDGRPGHTHLA